MGRTGQEGGRVQAVYVASTHLSKLTSSEEQVTLPQHVSADAQAHADRASKRMRVT